MKMITRLGCAALSLAFCMTATARSLSFDDWTTYIGQFSGASTAVTASSLPYGVLPSAVTSLELNPGAGASAYQIVTDANLPPAFFKPGDMYTWFGTDAPNTDPNDQQFLIVPQSATSLSIVFNDDSLSCAGQTASFSLNGTTYKSASPCTAGMALGTTDPACLTCTGYNSSAFSFAVINGKVQLQGSLPMGWTAAATAAPELDVKTAASGLTLLIGSLLVFLGRRRRSLQAIG